MARGVVIPADEGQPIYTEEFQDYLDYQRNVGGVFQVLDLDTIKASLFINEEGKLLKLPGNRRATYLWWASISAYVIGDDVLSGDVVLIGLPDDDGDTQSLSDELVYLFTKTDQFKVEFGRAKDDATRISAETLPNVTEAYEYACIIRQRFPDVTYTKVVPA